MKKHLFKLNLLKSALFIFCLLTAGFQNSFAQSGLITFSVTQFSAPPTPTITPGGSNAICAGGSIVLTSSSTSGNTWSNGSTSQSILVTSTGSYSVSVSANGCTSSSAPVTVTTNSPTISVTLTNPTCGNANGSITATVSGSSTYTLQWSNGDFGNTADSLVAGQYVVQVTDAQGCVTSQVVNLNASNGPSVSLLSQGNVTCPGGNNGSVSIATSGGAAPLNILWSNGNTTGSISGLSAGVYDVVVSDASGCEVNSSFTVSEPAPFNFSFSTTEPSCGATNGSITATVGGGNQSYTLSWGANTGNQSGPVASNIGPGIYTLSVTDGSGCTGSASTLVNTSVVGPSLNFNTLPSSGCGNAANGSIDMSITGGSLPYNVTWSTGATSEDIGNIPAGTYIVAVEDGNGCCSSGQVIVADGSGNTNPEICIVTVDSTTNTNKVIWEKPGSANGIKDYKIFREGSALGVYNLIATLPFDSLSEFTDPIANPGVRAWRYKMTYVDSCGDEKVLSLNHKTIHLAVNNGLGGVKNLAWDDYEGFPFLTFNIWRYHASTGWVKLDSLPSNLHSYTDMNPPGGGTLDYAIEVVKPNSCSSTRGIINTTRSNIRNITAPLSTGLSDVFSGSLKIYPNPAKENFCIELFSKENQTISVKLCDMRGAEVKYQQLNLSEGQNKRSVEVTGLATGLYYIHLFNADGILLSVKKMMLD
ncbi:MAG: T9SS type A sorting domain-containing protein [Bacteroidota bacterium]